MTLRKGERLVSSRSQSENWECVPRGSASGQATGGGASEKGSQPPGWEPVRAKLIAFLSAIRLDP
ncbi:hypothetical protein [Nostoc sp.]|uniref:hypothetical protein n=1 Tax=Nostoc sp. TaxID=1180 RepID=UPI002FFBE49E